LIFLVNLSLWPLEASEKKSAKLRKLFDFCIKRIEILGYFKSAQLRNRLINFKTNKW
jgi:hypothetical protein